MSEKKSTTVTDAPKRPGDGERNAENTEGAEARWGCPKCGCEEAYEYLKVHITFVNCLEVMDVADCEECRNSQGLNPDLGSENVCAKESPYHEEPLSWDLTKRECTSCGHEFKESAKIEGEDHEQKNNE